LPGAFFACALRARVHLVEHKESSASAPRVLTVILLYPLVLAAPLWFALRRHRAPHGWWWFVAWAAAGALFTFSFITGFSIGLFALPFAAMALFWLAARSGGRETVGLIEGAGWTFLLIACIQSESGGGGWLAIGLAFSFGALGTYAALQR
jgi:hypothetical protein